VRHQYIQPRYLLNSEGSPRRVGFELEFSGLDIEQAANIVASVFSGVITRKSSVQFEVSSRKIGSFSIELDWNLGKKIAADRSEQDLPEGHESHDILMGWLKWIAGQVVPVEVVCPPMVFTSLELLDIMVEKLRQAGAKGTDDSLIYAFGVHINPEIPASDAATIAAYLQAFCLSQEWLFEESHVDPIRKVTPYIKGYPEKYIETVLQYQKDITYQEMISDYMLHNPTRNRALDMLPLWYYLFPEYCKNFNLNDTLTSKRPTFHYRLPNCEIDKTGWYLSDCWNLWCVVEYLASNEEPLNSLRKSRRISKEQSLLFPDKKWHSTLKKIYHDL
jgi:hypothetical protein